MHQATVGHLLKEEDGHQKVLLGKRNTLFCQGLWNGAGGKMKQKESPRMGLRREVEEEWGVRIDIHTIRHFATVDFYHPFRDAHRLEWKVHFYQVFAWEGEPQIIEGFSELRWFKLSELPYGEMVVDNKVWMPMTLNGIASGRPLIGDVFYGDPDMKTVSQMAFRFIDSKAQRRTQ